jgi:hypothetical protein
MNTGKSLPRSRAPIEGRPRRLAATGRPAAVSTLLPGATEPPFPARPRAEDQHLSIERVAGTGKIEPAGHGGRRDAEGGRFVATRLTTKKPEAEKPAAKKAPAKKAAANGPATSAGAKPATKAKKRLPAATIRALKELEAGKLNRYADAADMFQKLGIKLGKEDKS